MPSSLDEKFGHSPESAVISDVPAIPNDVNSEDARDAAQSELGRRALLKLDLRLLPLVSLLYLISYIDRTNIGNAKVAGLTTDLHLTGLQYNICLAVFFMTYCFSEVPSNLIMKLWRPSRWLPILMVVWGAVTVSIAFTQNFGGLVTARFFLGLAEGGLFPGVIFYLCKWYPRASQAQRIGIFQSMATLAGAFGGLLAFAIEKMDGIGGLAGWRWIFVLEGILTAVVAVISHFCIYDSPESATFLSDREHAWLLSQLRKDNVGLTKKFKWRFLLQALADPHTYLMIVIYLLIIVPVFSFALFLPSIISGLGFSNSSAQLLTIPPYAASAFTTIGTGVLSDRLGARGPVVLGGSLLALMGFVVLIATTAPGAGYAGTVLAASGLYPCVACAIAWTGGNVGGEVKRAVVLAMVIGVGNLGGIASSFVYRPQDSPRYIPGHATAIACLSLTALLSSAGMLEILRLNRKKRILCAREGITEDDTARYVDMGDASPLFRYKI